MQQKGKAIWAVYTTTKNKALDSANCSFSIDGQLNKHGDEFFIRMYKDKIISNPTGYGVSNAINYFEFKYEKREDGEYLIGKWFAATPNKYTQDGSAGGILLKKMSGKSKFEIDQYFPKLPKLIEKYNRGDTAFTVPH